MTRVDSFPSLARRTPDISSGLTSLEALIYRRRVSGRTSVR